MSKICFAQLWLILALLAASPAPGATPIPGFTNRANTWQYTQTFAAASFTSVTVTSLTAASVPYVGAGGAISQDNANFQWDGTNHTLGIGIAAQSDMRVSVEYAASNQLSGTGYRMSRFSSTAAAAADKPGVLLGFDTSGAGIVAANTVSEGNALAFWTFNGTWAERGRFSKAGNFLIGTTTDLSAAYKLQIEGNGTVISRVKNIATSGTSNYAAQTADSDAVSASLVSWGTGGARAGTAWVSTVTNHPLVFGQYDNEAARISPNKNFLIGTATDDGTSKLQVDGVIKSNVTFSAGSTQEAWGLRLTASQGGAWWSRSGVQFHWNDTGNNYAFNAAGVIGGASAWDGTVGAGYLGFYTKSSSVPSVDPTEKMRLTGAGNVLIGTTTDDTVNKLQVAGGITTNSGSVYGGGEIILSGGANSNNAVYTVATGAPYMFFAHRGASNTGSFVWKNGTNAATTRMTLSAEGSLVLSALSGTTATDGFLYIPYVAGVPTGTPTNWGPPALAFDTQNNRLYIYANGAWKYAQFN